MSLFKFVKKSSGITTEGAVAPVYAVEHDGNYIGTVRQVSRDEWLAVSGQRQARRRTRHAVAQALLDMSKNDSYDTYLHRAQNLSNAGLMFLAAYLLKELTDDQRYDAIEAAREYEKLQWS